MRLSGSDRVANMVVSIAIMRNRKRTLPMTAKKTIVGISAFFRQGSKQIASGPAHLSAYCVLLDWYRYRPLHSPSVSVSFFVLLLRCGDVHYHRQYNSTYLDIRSGVLCCVVLCPSRENDGTENCPTCTYLLDLDPQSKAICLFVRVLERKKVLLSKLLD